MGILSAAGIDKVCFTSNLILRVCPDVFYPAPRISAHLEGQFGASPAPTTGHFEARDAHLSPRRLASKLAANNGGPSENLFHVELYSILIHLIPENWKWTSEAHTLNTNTAKKIDLVYTVRVVGRL